MFKHDAKKIVLNPSQPIDQKGGHKLDLKSIGEGKKSFIILNKDFISLNRSAFFNPFHIINIYIGGFRNLGRDTTRKAFNNTNVVGHLIILWQLNS